MGKKDKRNGYIQSKKVHDISHKQMYQFPKRDEMFWKPFKEYNSLDTDQRSDALKHLGLSISDNDIIRILAKSHFVIPGYTRYECKTCGECCRYARKVATFTYESCSFLTECNLCGKHENRYLVCKWFPFWIYNDEIIGPLLTIKPYCSGYGYGDLVDYNSTMLSILNLSIEKAKEDDGAIVMHELLHLPGMKEWVFPTKQNVDKLLGLIAKSDELPLKNTLAVSEQKGQLNYAQFYTSGLLGSLVDPQLTVSEDCIITDVNDPFIKLCRRNRDDLVGKSLPTLFINSDGMLKSIKICFYRGRITALTNRLLVDETLNIPVLIDALVYRDRIDGMIHGILISIRETSNIIYNELTQSRTYSRGLIEASLDAFMVIDLDGTLVDVNNALIQISGFSRDELIGSPFTRYFNNPEKAMMGVNTTFDDGHLKNFELDMVTVNSECIPVSFNATVFNDHEGTRQGIFAVARDIRETRIIMEDLQEAKNYARGLIESSLDLMVTINCNGFVTDVNESAVILTGYTREELSNSLFRDYFTDTLYAQQGIQLALREGKVVDYRLNLINRNNDQIPVSFNASLYYDHEGTVVGIFAIARDMRRQ